MLEEVVDGRIKLILPVTVLSELERVLAEKFGWVTGRIQGTLETLTLLAVVLPRSPDRVEAVCGDPDDDEILACAVEAGVDVLVTGDRKHLLPLGEHRGVRILTPQALLAELRATEP